jgi:hypothetical protein
MHICQSLESYAALFHLIESYEGESQPYGYKGSTVILFHDVCAINAIV